MRLKIYRCFCGKLAQYTVISVYWNKWIKFRIHFSAVFPDCLGAKGSMRRLAPTTKLAPEPRVARLGRFSRCLWQNIRNLINYSWKKCNIFRFFLLSFASHALIHAPKWCRLRAEQFHWKFRGLKNRSSWWYGKKRKTSSEHDKLCQFCVFIAPNHSAASLQLSFTQKHRCWFGARDTSQSGRTAERWIFEKRSNRPRTSNYTWIYTILVGY